jgi:hypothetical protein
LNDFVDKEGALSMTTLVKNSAVAAAAGRQRASERELGQAADGLGWACAPPKPSPRLDLQRGQICLETLRRFEVDGV